MLIEDDEIVAITAEASAWSPARRGARERAEMVIPWDEAAAERGGFETFMLKEIYEQPEAVAETLAAQPRPKRLGGLRCSRWVGR